jgi:hypothetical protein
MSLRGFGGFCANEDDYLPLVASRSELMLLVKNMGEEAPFSLAMQ